MSNIMSFVGTVVRNAEVRVLPNGGTVCNVTIANDQGWGEKKTVLFIRVALWGKRAEGTFPTLLVRGKQIFVSGELSQREYQGNDGTTKNSLELNANIIDLVGKRESPVVSDPLPVVSEEEIIPF